MKKSGSIFMEYVIILGVVSAVFIGMNTYITRGIQGRLKEMTDFFIGKEQVVETNPLVLSTVNTTTTSDIDEEKFMQLGGGAGISLDGQTDTAISSRTEDFVVPAPLGSFIAAESGTVTPPPNPHQQQQ